MKMFHKRYELLRETPTHKAGWPLRWDGKRRKYFYPKVSTWSSDKGGPDIYLDSNGPAYTIEEVESKPDWFKPSDEAVPYVPAFPSKDDLEEFVYLSFETRLVDDVDECRALSDLFRSDEFRGNLYDFVRDEYNRHHFGTRYSEATT
ncbi:hypothetical protein [Mycolicibacterium neoaurum]|uniref:hypothetical protein n=1 Tax=Mycolicibacterium neoaurum TaxID=1795 RepID=UPI001F4C5311|nr:hypothetical protein [Mycolicibacterium neoaurum]